MCRAIIPTCRPIVSACHEADYNATTNPNHLSAGIDNVCMECHTTMPGWKPAIFEHSSFPLTQGHAINDCNACHVPGDYSNVSTDCFACHEADYNATTNPNHLSAGIDNVCMECHTTMPGGSLPISPNMMACFSPYIQEDTGVNGTPAPNVTATLPTIRSFPVSIAMNTTGRTWMTSIRAKMVMNITVWHAWIATQQGVRIKYWYEIFINAY